KLIERGELDGQGGTSLLAQAAVDAAGKIDAEPGGKTAAILALSTLHGDATGGAHRGAEKAGHTAFVAIRIPGQDDARPGPLRQEPLILRVLLGDRPAPQVAQHHGQASPQAGDAS